jgi:Ca2+-binding RTX toxin-like protein
LGGLQGLPGKEKYEYLGGFWVELKNFRQRSKMSVTLPNATKPNAYTTDTVDTLIGGAAADTVVVTGSIANAKIDLLAGNDKLTLADGDNSATISNVETIIGGGGGDTLTIETAMSKGTVNLGGGSDTLILANGTNTVTVTGVETLIGGNGADTIALGSALTNDSSIDLGAGKDKLTLGEIARDSCRDTVL